jgi:hypothetical protein
MTQCKHLNWNVKYWNVGEVTVESQKSCIEGNFLRDFRKFVSKPLLHSDDRQFNPDRIVRHSGELLRPEATCCSLRLVFETFGHSGLLIPVEKSELKISRDEPSQKVESHWKSPSYKWGWVRDILTDKSVAKWVGEYCQPRKWDLLLFSKCFLRRRRVDEAELFVKNGKGRGLKEFYRAILRVPCTDP